MQFRNGSLYRRLSDRVGDAVSKNTEQDQWLAQNSTRISELETRVNNYDSRITSLETWRGDKAPAVNDVTTETSGLSVNVEGVEVMASNSTRARLGEYGNAINEILARLRMREMIQT